MSVKIDTRIDPPHVVPTRRHPPEPAPARTAPSRSLGWYGPGKLALDFLLALTLAVVALPVLLVVAVLVKLTSRGPVLYSQTRLGKGGRPYRIFKIRTMVVDSEKNGACWSVPGDPRVTRLGRFLRRTHLDELPQLWNILRGEMSLIGPRPERPEFVPALERSIPRYRERLAVRPGVTGLAQVQLPADTDLESVKRKLQYDLCYVERCGLWLDLRIFLATALKMAGVSFPALARIFFLPCPGGAALASRDAAAEDSDQETAQALASIPTAGGGQSRVRPLLLNSPEQA
jgi:lipopolysaccharide/colanic/teichoic acid biosynthesis glycosyltransferase